jgi:hypothetical protein
MNRRDFFSSLALGGLAVLASSALVNTITAAVPVRRIGSGPVEWSILEKDKRIVYRFHKGPDYTTLEEAFPHMQDIVDKVTGWCKVDESFANRVVILESVTFGS